MRKAGQPLRFDSSYSLAVRYAADHRFVCISLRGTAAPAQVIVTAVCHAATAGTGDEVVAAAGLDGVLTSVAADSVVQDAVVLRVKLEHHYTSVSDIRFSG